MPYHRIVAMPYLLAGIAEGTAISSMYGYGPLYMREVLNQPSLGVASLTIGLASFASFIMAGVWGRLGDRTGKTAFLVTLGMLIGTSSLFALPSISNASFFIFLTVLAAAGVAASAPLGVAWLTLQEPEQPGVAAARYYRSRTIGWALGSYGTSYVVQLYQIHGLIIAFRLSAVLCLSVAVWLAWTARRDKREARLVEIAQQKLGTDSQAPMGKDLSSNIVVWRQPLVLAVSLAVLLGFGGNEAFFALMGPYFTEYLHGSASLVGAALGTASLTGVLVIGFVGRLADRRGPALVFMLGSLGYAAVYLLMTLLRYPLPTIILFTVPLYPFMATGVTGLMVRYLPVAQRAEAIGVYEGSAALAASLGSMLGGAVADVYGLGIAPVLALLLAGAGVAVAWVGITQVSHTRTS